MGAAYEKGMILYRMKRYREAAEHFREELAAWPAHAPAKSMLALSLLYAGRKKEAWEAVSSVMGEAPTYAFGFYAAAHVVRQYQPRGAKPKRRSFRLTLSSSDAQLPWKLSRAYVLDALRLAPDHPDYLATLAESEAAMGNWPACLDAAER